MPLPSLRLMPRYAWLVVTALWLAAALFFLHDPRDPGPFDSQGYDVAASPAPARAGAQTNSTPVRGPANSREDREPLRIVCALAMGAALIWATYAFTGRSDQRMEEAIKFAYFFAVASFVTLAIPLMARSQAIGNEPIAVISGCVEDPKAAEQLRCFADGAKPGTRARNQWLISIGGTLAPQLETPAPAAPAEAPVAAVAGHAAAPAAGAAQQPAPGQQTGQPSAPKLGSAENRAVVTGGLVIPLPFVLIALFGGAVSLSRRVPEIQKRSSSGYQGTSAEPHLRPCEVREMLMFQIMQFISAPLIAIVAYEVIRPDSEAAAIGLAFLSGFGSESILLMVRAAVDGVKPRNPTAPVPGGQGQNPPPPPPPPPPPGGPAAAKAAANAVLEQAKKATLAAHQDGLAPAEEPDRGTSEEAPLVKDKP